MEAQLLEARQPKAVQTSELQKELEGIEKAIEDAENIDSQKRDWLAKQLEEVHKQRIDICAGILEKQARAKVIVEQLAERAFAAPAAASAPVAVQVAPQLQVAQVSAFLSSTKAELDVTCASGAALSGPTKQMLKQLSGNWSFFEEVGALLVSTRTAVNNEVSYAAGVVSTDMPPTQTEIANGLFPERTPNAVGQQHSLLEPPVPLPMPTKGLCQHCPASHR